MANNPIARPMSTLVDQSVAAAAHLRGKEAGHYKAAVALAKLLAGQIDDANMAGDPDTWNKINMRVIPNFHRVLFTLGLTPEGFARITTPIPAGGRLPKEGPSEPKASVAKIPEEDLGDELDAIVTDLNAARARGKGQR